ncbi:MAG TPA: acetyltransferase [candidate division Zixibacteria bacterium]|nr:acetyltransferase [candidate division Zixibacteria bacterium]HER00115.1 acetyltransferase [candidate division Zixibacteria bacterium]
MNRSQIVKYLHRIGIEKAQSPDLRFLAALQKQHLLNVPFENLDIRRGREIVLDCDSLYKKIVLERRGGYCYELNGLFCKLLRELGYSVDMLSARVFNSAGILSQEFDHMTLMVHLDNDYLVDVGFGDSSRKPIEMPGGETEDVSGKYRIKSNPEIESCFFLQKFTDQDWHPRYRFTTIPRELADFQGMNEYHQTSPESHFTQKSICTIATEEGRISLSDKFLTITEGTEKDKSPLPSGDHFKNYLKQYFDIEL